jgi:AcrR family transcriptional regulator
VRAAILDAAEERIAAQGLHTTSLVEIAKAAGVAVGTLYNYFEDRDAMVRALFETRRSTLRPRVHAAMSAGSDLAFEPRLRRFMRELFEAFEPYHLYIRVVFQAEHLKPQGSHVDLLAAIAEIVGAGVREGVIPANRADTLELVLSGAIRSVLMRRSESGQSFVADAEPICELLLDGARRR